MQIKAIKKEISHQEGDLEVTETNSSDKEMTKKKPKKQRTSETAYCLKAWRKNPTKTKDLAYMMKNTNGGPKSQRRAICKFFMHNNCRHGVSIERCKCVSLQTS